MTFTLANAQAKGHWTPAELLDLLTEAIADSVDMDWQPRRAAEAVLREIADHGLAISAQAEAPAPATVAASGEVVEALVGHLCGCVNDPRGLAEQIAADLAPSLATTPEPSAGDTLRPQGTSGGGE